MIFKQRDRHSVAMLAAIRSHTETPSTSGIDSHEPLPLASSGTTALHLRYRSAVGDWRLQHGVVDKVTVETKSHHVSQKWIAVAIKREAL